MSGKPERMSQIKQILRRYTEGKGIKYIARELSVSKNTVKSYVNKFKEGEFSISEILQDEDPVLEAKLFAGHPSYKDERYEYLKEHFEYYFKELKRVGVNRQLLWEEYCQGTTNPYSYAQFCHHLQQYKKSSRRTMHLDYHFGEKLYIDFVGKKLSYVDKTPGEEVYVQIFVAYLPYSNCCFAIAVPTQQTEDFIFALTCCFIILWRRSCDLSSR